MDDMWGNDFNRNAIGPSWHKTYISQKSRLIKMFCLPSIAAEPIAVGIISPEALTASNLDINTDILKNEANNLCNESKIAHYSFENCLTLQVERCASFANLRELCLQCACRFRLESRLRHLAQGQLGHCTRPQWELGNDSQWDIEHHIWKQKAEGQARCFFIRLLSSSWTSKTKTYSRDRANTRVIINSPWKHTSTLGQESADKNWKLKYILSCHSIAMIWPSLTC